MRLRFDYEYPVPARKTDLLFGITSMVPGKVNRHFFLGDFDVIGKKDYHDRRSSRGSEPTSAEIEDYEKRLMDKVGTILFNKHGFGTVYLVKSGKGYHLACFSVELPLRLYVRILKEMGADEKYIRWVRKVRYGVLRVSRRSSHKLVPEFQKILVPPWKKEENVPCRDFYIHLLKMEDGIESIERVRVLD